MGLGAALVKWLQNWTTANKNVMHATSPGITHILMVISTGDDDDDDDDDNSDKVLAESQLAVK